MLKGFVTTEQAADRLDVSASRIRQMILSGLIKGAQKVGQNNIIPEREIKRLEGLERKAGRPKKPHQKKAKEKI